MEREVFIAKTREGSESAAAEASACVTAAVVTRIGRLASPNSDVTINGGEAGVLTMRIRKALTDVQHDRA